MTKDRNKSILDAAMSFIDGLGEGEVYAKEKVYSKEELNRVTREDYFVFHARIL